MTERKTYSFETYSTDRNHTLELKAETEKYTFCIDLTANKDGVATMVSHVVKNKPGQAQIIVMAKFEMPSGYTMQALAEELLTYAFNAPNDAEEEDTKSYMFNACRSMAEHLHHKAGATATIAKKSNVSIYDGEWADFRRCEGYENISLNEMRIMFLLMLKRGCTDAQLKAKALELIGQPLQ